MTNFTYTDNIPSANNKPSVDQPKMQVNTTSIDQLIAVDHISFNTTNGGYHTIIHGPQQNRTRSGAGAVTANFPTQITGVMQTFVASYTPDTSGAVADTQLFTLTGLGGLSQMSGSLHTDDGYFWSGGILFQWGFRSLDSNSQTRTITFKDRSAGCIPFPNNCFNVSATLKAVDNTVSSSDNTLSIIDFTNLQFRARFNGKVSNYDGFYWMAIGN